MPFSVLDLIVLGIVLISALLAAVRGFTREVLAIVAWVVAAAAESPGTTALVVRESSAPPAASVTASATDPARMNRLLENGGSCPLFP